MDVNMMVGQRSHSLKSFFHFNFTINIILLNSFLTYSSLACANYYTSMMEKVPVGFRFHPRDEELVGHYLRHKLLGNDSMVHDVIAEVDVCKFEPWELPAFSKIKSDDPEWFFFSPICLKFTKTTRFNRKTKAGYWKITGKDRSIKTRGTNNVMGTKKTLVFYKSCGHDRVRTNWVIHEYHAVTFPNDKRVVVLCRLMEKAGKKVEGGTDALILDEGEPSSLIPAHYENRATADGDPYVSSSIEVFASPEVNPESFFLASPQAEEYSFPSLHQSPIFIEQEPYLQGSTFPNACFGNENGIVQFPFETTEEEDNIDSFLDLILADEDDTSPAVDNSLTKVNDESSETEFELPLPKSLRKACCESSETDVTLLSEQHGNNILHTTSSMFESSHDAVHGGPPPVSSTIEVNSEEEDNTFEDNSTANACLSICLIQRVSSPPPRSRSSSPSRASSSSPPSRCQSNNHPRSHNAEGKSQTQISISSPAVSQQEELMETHSLKSSKEKREAQCTSSKKGLKTTRYPSSGVIGKGSFNHLTSPLVQKSWFLFLRWRFSSCWHDFES